MAVLNSQTMITSNLVTTGMTVNGTASTTSGMNALAEIISSPTPGEVSFTTPGTFTFIVPAGVTRISAVAIGAGASGGYTGLIRRVQEAHLRMQTPWSLRQASLFQSLCRPGYHRNKPVLPVRLLGLSFLHKVALMALLQPGPLPCPAP